MLDPERAIFEVDLSHSLGMHCGDCGAAVEVAPRDLLRIFILGLEVRCPRCGNRYDVWHRTVEQLSFGVFGRRYAAIGANVAAAQLLLKRDQPLLLHLEDLGIPATGWVEEIHLTPSGGEHGWLQPVFMRDPQPPHPANAPLLIYPVPIQEGACQGRSKVDPLAPVEN
jgi:DNA-directed RNA polymerase subunit RPC12/RpoP